MKKRSMLINIFTIIISLFILLWSANHLIVGASGIARSFQLPPLFIGLTIVAIGTTAPEIMVSIVAATEGKTNMAIGNAIGSNIANIGLVLGITALIQPLKAQSQLLKREYPVLFIVMILIYLLTLDQYLGQIDGLILLLGAMLLLLYFAWLSHRKRISDPYRRELNDILANERSRVANSFSILIGILLLPLSARWLVNSAAEIAQALGVSDLIIGLTMIAVGTSLPELATSVLAALKKEEEIAIGNILGSNMFNILLVIAFPGLIHPAKVNDAVVWRDIPMMFFFSVLLLLFNLQSDKKINRYNGALLILTYLIYLVYLIMKTSKL